MSYRIVRKYRDSNHPDHNMVVDDDVTLEEAQEHCSSEDTHEKGVWFDCYYENDRQQKPYHASLTTLAQLINTKHR